jgi:peptidoglycan biosynthesis protein MviN/MurJ (putative lipid II flippase)
MNESTVVLVGVIVLWYVLIKREFRYSARDVSTFSLVVRLLLSGVAMELYIVALLHLLLYLNPGELPALFLPAWALGWAGVTAIIFRTGRRIKKGQRNAGQ